MQQEKQTFLQTEMFEILNALSDDTAAGWGVMNAQQMLEHLADIFDVSYEKIIFPLSVPEEYLPKYKAFLWSDKEFRENTKAPSNIIGNTPAPLKHASLETAKQNLKTSVEKFIEWFKNDALKTSMHPAFGTLNFEEWIILHHKHVRHHFKQFGLMG